MTTLDCTLAMLVVGVSMSCAPLQPGSVRLDPEPELRAPTERAVERLAAATGIEIGVSEGEADLTVAVVELPQAALSGQLDGRVWSGHFNGHRIALNRDTGQASCRRTLLHEILHAAMLSDSHVADGQLLAAAGECADRLSARDLAFFCSEAPCRWMRPEADPSNERTQTR